MKSLKKIEGNKDMNTETSIDRNSSFTSVASTDSLKEAESLKE